MAKAAPAPPPPPPPPLAPLAVNPVGPPATLAVDVLPVDEFYRELINDVRSAPRVDMGTFIFDHPGLTNLLERRLWGSTPFALTIMVDREQFESGEYYYQRSRLRRLFEGGGKVYLCRGPPPQGSFHVKALVVGRRRLYAGSPNFTYKSERNTELPLRITGPPVLSVLKLLDEARSRATEWDGR